MRIFSTQKSKTGSMNKKIPCPEGEGIRTREERETCIPAFGTETVRNKK